MKKFFLVLLSMALFAAPSFAQGQLSEAEIQNIVEKMENDWQFAHPIVQWLDDEYKFDFYMRMAPQRTPEELQNVLDFGKESYEQGLQVLQVEKQVYPKPGRKKSEASLAKYFKDTEKAKAKFAAVHTDVARYEQMADLFPKIIAGMRTREYVVPQGALVHYEFHSGGGMIRRPAVHLEVARQDDGSYVARLNTNSFDKLDTVALTKEQVDHIRQLLIEGEAYKMPAYHDTPVMLLDGPSSSASVEFEDRSYSCSDFPPSDWGGKAVSAVNKYLREIHPLPEMTEEERRMW